MDSLVSTEWLAGELDKSDLRIVDATYFLDKNARAKFDEEHIPGAVFMDLAELADQDSDLPGMLPSAEKFASRMQALGLGDGSRIVVYDDSPLKTAARAWWMLKTFGAHEVAVLDGGLSKWKSENRPVESGKASVRHRHFTVWKDESGVRTLSDMKENQKTGAEQVVDARPAARFTGEEDDPREGVAAGHIRGAKNVPHSQLFNDDGTYKSKAELKQIFSDAGIDTELPVVTMCGSGITAAVLSFALHLIGAERTALYDGSWTEWGGQSDTNKVTGAA
ncbi:3-mercaptopyruvate sulfurtransferase [Pacificimonas flava]|uniref:3-mercaptopyruvate sulfurtransferase n=2 Tax=Pacificimonas TaxID=1960290 RepID=A0A219B5J6_9SPHN|nr:MULTISPECIES: 3-mercaptopyruvate sulfurtransferase [Pacificimonas]MBZ6379130.1 3-mercaptopyruvate sulfurtransferase [Pacificimonas aurantium]OWV33640.1 3-mercaptopyruvate sulfurtransferase [Pacificimonas flava]